MHTLQEIEKQLNELIAVDKQNWANFYLLIKEVEEQELWKGEYEHFTAWLRQCAIKNKIEVSVLWNRKRAGEIYTKYANRKAAKDEAAADIRTIGVAQDSLITIEKIAKLSKENQDETIEELTDKVLNKEIKKKDLDAMYRVMKARKEEVKRLQTELEDKNISDEDKEKASNILKDLKGATLTAIDIVDALRDSKWLNVDKMGKRSFKKFYEQDKYRIFTEFPMYTGGTRKSRKVDVLVCENLTEERWKLNLHAVEIKVSKYDLLNDYKFTSYAEFCDFLWLAIPEELLEVAKTIKPPECGIIVVTKDRAKVIEEATRLEPIAREDCLATLSLKLL